MARNIKDDGNAMHIGQAIQQLLGRYNIKSKFDEANLVSSWERLVGKPIAKRTKKLYIRNKVLFVELESPSLKNDLAIHKSHLIEVLQKEFGTEVVKDLVIM